jgi:hypothetical protein
MLLVLRLSKDKNLKKNKKAGNTLVLAFVFPDPDRERLRDGVS